MTTRKTRSFTNLQQAASERAEVDAALDTIVAARGDALPVERLSDLSRVGAARLRERWLDIANDRRLHIVTAMVADSELHIERHYERALLAAFEDDDTVVRRAALEGLWEHQDVGLLDTLLAEVATESDDPLRVVEVVALGRYARMAALGELDDARAERLRAVLLGLVTRDADTEVQRAALESVSYFSGDSAATTAISDAFTAGSDNWKVSALRGMARQADPRWLDDVAGEFASDEPELRFEAARAAGAIGDQRLVTGLIDLVDDDDIEVQLMAIGSLGDIGGQFALNTLRRLLQSDRPAITEAAREALDEADLAAGRVAPRV